MQAIYEKQGRSAQYASVEERDSFLRKEIKGLQKSVKAKEGTLGELQRQAAASTVAVARLQQACAALPCSVRVVA